MPGKQENINDNEQHRRDKRGQDFQQQGAKAGEGPGFKEEVNEVMKDNEEAAVNKEGHPAHVFYRGLLAGVFSKVTGH